MKKPLVIILIAIVFNTPIFAQQAKTISDCTITFSVSDSLNTLHIIGSKVIYIKGKDIRTDLTTSKFSQTIFYNSKEGNATVLKNVGQSKYISYYTADEWKNQNDIYTGITVSLTGNTKTILDYDCKEAILNLKNGTSYIVYYVPSLIPSVVENPFEFKDVPGLVLEYESSNRKDSKITFKAEKINFDPVPSVQFEIPVKGYRLLKNEN